MIRISTGEARGRKRHTAHLDQAGEKTHPARRWVAERTIAWLQKRLKRPGRVFG